MDTLATAHIWLIAGAVLLALEAFGVPGIGLFFAGLAAILVGILVQYDIINSGDIVIQFAIFFAATAITAVALWKTLKRWRTSSVGAGSYHNMVGDRATVSAEGLKAGEVGQVNWSGTQMRAEIDPACGFADIAGGRNVEITAVNGNTLIVKPL